MSPSEKAVTRTRDQVIDELTSAGGPFQIVEQIVRGVPMRVYAVPPRTLRDVLASTAQFGDNPFLVYSDERWTTPCWAARPASSRWAR